MGRASLLGLIAGLALAAPGAAAPLRVPPLELVHVEANTGVAAGGHVALRAGDHAYHWQVAEDGWLRLGRQPWEPFRMRYRILENRPLRVVSLDLDEAGRELVHRELQGLWSRQSHDLRRLEAFELARAWAEHSVGGPAPVLPGAGFFAAEGGDPHALALRAHLEQTLGAGLLERRRREVEEALAAGVADPVALRDTLLLREALHVLAEGRGIAPHAMVRPDSRALTERERSALAEFGDGLADSVARLLGSARRDRGRPLLLAIARHQVVARSLALGRLQLLDAVAADAIALDPAASPRHRALVEQLAERAVRGFERTRVAVFEAGLDEAAYNDLEEAATGVYEVQAALLERRPMRMRPIGRLVPARPGPVSPHGGLLAPLDVAAARAAEADLRAALHERYAYELVLHNCATALAALLRATAPGSEPSWLSFVPARLVSETAASEIGGEQRILQTWRRAQVAEAARREGRLRVALRESNTLTSRVYAGSISDDHFLFFADGARWLRPLQGGANFLYGLGHASAGLLSAPFDRGDRLVRGLEGAFYSVPELVGVSIRKGRYDLLPE